MLLCAYNLVYGNFGTAVTAFHIQYNFKIGH